MIRAAIYARYSSDLQNDHSIDDQIALCRDLAAREDMTIVTQFEDRAASGASTHNRPGFTALMQAAEARLFDAIVIEDLDRLSRDQGDYHTARKRLDFLGITIHTATGQVTRMDGALRALMSEMFLENLAMHTRRGLEGVIRSGRHAGGRAYGYRAVEGKPGELAIVESEADIIREIFTRYAAGETPRDIAQDLNRRNIAPPRGPRWNASTINGNLARGHGILLNDIYSGRIVWNRVRMIKDPRTGKRVSRINPKESHRTADAAHLRIVDAELWARVQTIKQIKSVPHPESTRRPKRVLSGLLKCGTCGGGMSSVGNDRHGKPRIQCSAHNESGSCNNGRKVSLTAVETKTLDGLHHHLMSPVYIAEYVKAYNEERRNLARTDGDRRGKLTARKAAIARELERLIDAITQGVNAATIAPRMAALESEAAEIETQLASAEAAGNVITLHPAAVERYAKAVKSVSGFLKEGYGTADNMPAMVEQLRTLISAVIVRAPPNSVALEIEIRGHLAELIEAPFPARSGWGGETMVARGRFSRSPLPFKAEFALKIA